MTLGIASNSNPINPLAVRSTVDAAAEWLRQSIMRGELKPGERLVEHKLAKQLSIGQPTLREALKELELQGFVRKTPKRGTFVTKLTTADFRRGLEVRMALETLAVERAALRLTGDLAEELQREVDVMTEAADRFDMAEFHRNDVAFHRALWAVADNDFLTLALERIAFGLFAFVLLQRKLEDRDEFRAAARQHQEIVDGLLTGNPAKARNAFIQSTLRFWNEYHGLQIQPSKGCQSALESPTGEEDAGSPD